MVRLIARVIGVGIETADMLVHEILSRKLRDRRAVARYAGLTGAPDESGSKRRDPSRSWWLGQSTRSPLTSSDAQRCRRLATPFACLMPPAYVKPYAKRHKNDANDAEAICEAATRPNMRFVATKTREQQHVHKESVRNTGSLKERRCCSQPKGD